MLFLWDLLFDQDGRDVCTKDPLPVYGRSYLPSAVACSREDAKDVEMRVAES
jgi:hypothetical protein